MAEWFFPVYWRLVFLATSPRRLSLPSLQNSAVQYTAAYGILISAIGWEYAIWMWLYVLSWFVFNDIVKVSTYRLLQSHGQLM